MANLDDMREFQQHWHAYRDEERRLADLCARVPLDISSLTVAERVRDLFDAPENLRLCAAAHEDVLAAALTAQPPITQEGDAAWGWWFEDDAWREYALLKPLVDERGALLAARAELNAKIEAALAADAAYQEACRAVEAYRTSNAEDAAARAELAHRLEHLDEGYRAAEGSRLAGARASIDPRVRVGASLALVAVLVALVLGLPYLDLALEARIALAVVIGLVALLLASGLPSRGAALVRERLWTRGEREHLERSLTDLDARVALRADEGKARGDEAEARRAELVRPFDEPQASIASHLEDVEGRMLALLDRDLTRRDGTYEAGALLELPFAEAYAAAQQREWMLLDAWMRAYLAALPHEVEHTANLRASEEVWLEAHDPFGRRHWEDTDEVVARMEAGDASDSDRALALVTAG